MRYQDAINRKKLWELATQGKTAPEIMRELDITDLTTMENVLEGLMREKGQPIIIPGLIGKSCVDGCFMGPGVPYPAGERSVS